MNKEIPANTIIHCPTEELANQVLEFLNKKDYTKCFIGNTFYKFGKDTCYSCNFLPNKKIGYSAIDYYLSENLIITEAEEFLKQYNMQKKEIKVEVPEGMEVDLEKSIMNEHEVSIVYKAIRKNILYDDIYNSLGIAKNQVALKVYYQGQTFELNFRNHEHESVIEAIIKLQNIANYYNKGIKLDFNLSYQEKFSILYGNCLVGYKIKRETTCNSGEVFFLNRADAQSVIDNPNFREILDKIYR